MIVLYDHDCGMCSRSVEKWNAICPDSVSFIPFDHFEPQAHGLSQTPDRGSVVIIEPDGTQIRSAEAVLKILWTAGRMRWLFWSYNHVPWFAFCAEFVYALIARNRHHISRICGLNTACAMDSSREIQR